MRTFQHSAVKVMAVLFVLFLISNSSAFAAEDTLIDATFSSQDDTPLGSISNDPSITSSGTIEYCADDLPLKVMIHAQTTGGTGAEDAEVELIIDGALILTDTLNMQGIAYVSVDHPDLSKTPGDTHEVGVKLIADSRYNSTETSGYVNVVDCEGEGEGEGGKLIPFKIKKKIRFIDDEPYVSIPLKRALDLIWLTRDKIDEMNRKGELKAKMRVMLPEHMVHMMEQIVNENPALQEELKEMKK